MKIGITYDTKEDYMDIDGSKYCDFASKTSISFLQKQFIQAGYDTTLIGSCAKLKELISSGKLDVDYIYNTAEGIRSRNREGIIPSLLEAYNIPYIGSDAYALSLTLNKYHTKLLAKQIGIPTPKSEIIYLYDSISERIEKLENLNFPLVIKPNYEGSSMGVFLVNSIEEGLTRIAQNQTDYQQEILCEEYIDGMESTVPIIGNDEKTSALGVIEFYRNDQKPIEIFNSDAKHYANVKCRKAQIPPETECLIKAYSERIHRFLGCRDINRVDFRITADFKIYLLEMNPLPALDPDGSFVCAARLQGMDFPQLLNRIINEAILRQNQ